MPIFYAFRLDSEKTRALDKIILELVSSRYLELKKEH